MTSVTVNKRLDTNLRELRLPVIRECYVELAEQAVKEDLGYEKYLLDVSGRECDTRREHRIERILRNSQLPLDKNLASLEVKRFPAKVNVTMNALLNGTFLDRAENVLVFGRPGTGKTHLLCALAQELAQKGRTVLFTTCGLLVQRLLIAKRDLKLERILKKLAKFEALIIDDIGYVQQDRDEMEVLFSLLASRYERGSVLLTSNLPFSKWEKIFKDPMTTAAAIDRLVHHSVILELNIASYRAEKARNRVGK